MTLGPLFSKIAPGFEPAFMLEILPKELPELDIALLELRLAEFLKFIFLRSASGKESLFVPVKKAIDEIWHLFIIQTREYERFCQALPGKYFIHHTTMHLDTFAHDKDKQAVMTEMLAWIPQYIQHFGPFTEKTLHYWVMPSFLQEHHGLSLSEINALH